MSFPPLVSDGGARLVCLSVTFDAVNMLQLTPDAGSVDFLSYI